jgi:hypothetical protein
MTAMAISHGLISLETGSLADIRFLPEHN